MLDGAYLLRIICFLSSHSLGNLQLLDSLNIYSPFYNRFLHTVPSFDTACNFYVLVCFPILILEQTALLYIKGTAVVKACFQNVQVGLHEIIPSAYHMRKYLCAVPANAEGSPPHKGKSICADSYVLRITVASFN